MIPILEPSPQNPVYAPASPSLNSWVIQHPLPTDSKHTQRCTRPIPRVIIGTLLYWEQEHSSLETIGAIYLPFTPICKPPRWGATPTFGSTLCCSSTPRRDWNHRHTPFFQPGARDQQNIEEHLRLARCGVWNIRDQRNLDAQLQRSESKIATLSEKQTIDSILWDQQDAEFHPPCVLNFVDLCTLKSLHMLAITKRKRGYISDNNTSFQHVPCQYKLCTALTDRAAESRDLPSPFKPKFKPFQHQPGPAKFS